MLPYSESTKISKAAENDLNYFKKLVKNSKGDFLVIRSILTFFL